MKPSLIRKCVVGFVALLLGACNFPMFSAGTPNPGMIYTSAAETQIANATLLARPVESLTFSFTPYPIGTPAGTTPAPTGALTITPAVTGSPSGDCDKAEFVSDVNVPDGTEYDPGDTFTKTWKLKNTGTCVWTPEYNLIFKEGEIMGAPAVMPLSTREVKPGEEIEVSVEFTAPEDPGDYQSDWELRNPRGQRFGVGTDGEKSFWVRIVVPGASGDGFDFLSQASSAEWIVEFGNDEEVIEFDGDLDDSLGAAAIADDARQEDGRDSAKILVTFPPREDNSRISGLYPEYRVSRDDRLRGRFGFLTGGDDDCNPGQAVFSILYRLDGDTDELGSWDKECDGRLVPIDIDLDDLRGETVEFILRVDTDGRFDGDLAFWSSLRVESGQ